MMIICSKKEQHPQFSGVVRNVGEKKWLQRKKEGRKRGGWRRGNLSRCALQTMYNFSKMLLFLVQSVYKFVCKFQFSMQFWQILVQIFVKKRQQEEADKIRWESLQILLSKIVRSFIGQIMIYVAVVDSSN